MLHFERQREAAVNRSLRIGKSRHLRRLCVLDQSFFFISYSRYIHYAKGSLAFDSRLYYSDSKNHQGLRALGNTAQNYFVISIMNQVKTTPGACLDMEKKGNQSSEDIDKKEEKREVLEWDKDDVKNPRNWSRCRKYWITLQLGMLAFAASVGSSITAPATNSIAQYAKVSHEVSVLSISLYM
jgi:hypothetical protein